MDQDRKFLSADLIAELAHLGARLQSGRRIDLKNGELLRLMNALSPSDVVRAAGEIADAANLWHQHTGLSLRYWGHVSGAEQLLRTSLLEYVFIFHRDGRLREAALRRVQNALPSAFLFAAVCWRLNDWVPQVRQAAVEAADRCFPKTDHDIVAEALVALLARKDSWTRWHGERRLFDDLLARPDVASSVETMIIDQPTGPMARLLRTILRKPTLDHRLTMVFRTAIQPSVRATALTILLNGEATWPSGKGWQWINKSMGLRAWRMQFDRRPVEVVADREELVALGVKDKSAVVRGAALSGAMRHFAGTPIERRYAGILKDDRSNAVRGRAAFILNRGLA